MLFRFFRTFFFFLTSNSIDVLSEDFLQPFANSVWIGLIVFIIISSILMTILFKTYQTKQMRSPDVESSSSFIIIFGVLCQQGINCHSFHRFIVNCIQFNRSSFYTFDAIWSLYVSFIVDSELTHIQLLYISSCINISSIFIKEQNQNIN